MTTADNAARVAAPPPGAAKLDWLRAFRALRRLLADKNDTAQVFEIMRALNGTATARNYRRLLTTPEGGRLAYERLELAGQLMDTAWLDRMPPGSVGAAYRDFVRAEQLSAEGLATLSRAGFQHIDQPHPYAWFGRRTRDVHDVWHVLAGYGRDSLGEACLVAFSYAQTKGLGWAMIALGVAHRARRHGAGQPYRRAIWEGFRRGRSARWLLGEDYERLLAEPLDAARRRLGVEKPPAIYHSIPVELRDRAAGAGA
jgi:ubiquinone biosynthesis protein COQ4